MVDRINTKARGLKYIRGKYWYDAPDHCFSTGHTISLEVMNKVTQRIGVRMRVVVGEPHVIPVGFEHF